MLWLSVVTFPLGCYSCLNSTAFFFLIRNKEEYINRRKDTGERKVTKEREETKGRMRGPSYTN